MALKFKNYSFNQNKAKYILLIVSLISIVLLQWLAAPVIFALYIVLSLLFKNKES